MRILQSFIKPQNAAVRLGLIAIFILLHRLSSPGGPFPLLIFITIVPVGLAVSSISAKQSTLLFYLAGVGLWISTTDTTEDIFVSPDSVDLDSGVLLGGANPASKSIYISVDGHPTNIDINNPASAAPVLVNVVRFFS